MGLIEGFVPAACLLMFASTNAQAMTFLPCPERVVEVPAHPRVVADAWNSLRTRFHEDTNEPVPPPIRAVSRLDATHTSITLDLEVGETMFVAGFLGARCSPRTLRAVADWHPDRTAPSAPDAAPYYGDQIQLTLPREREGETWWMRLEWAATPSDLVAGRIETSFDTWIAWRYLAPGEVVHLRMTKILADGSDSASWTGQIARDLDGNIVVDSRPAQSSTVHAVLSRADDPSPSRARDLAPSANRRRGDQGRLLLLAMAALGGIALRRFARFTAQSPRAH